jgi:hypothetical protein
MTTSANAWWTPEAWQTRLDSGNPVWPFEWAVGYQSGSRIPRIAAGEARTSRAVPLEGVAWLHVRGPMLEVDIPAPTVPIAALVVRATVVASVDNTQHRVSRWTFGFQTASGFHGILVDGTGRVTTYKGGTDPCDDSFPSSS